MKMLLLPLLFLYSSTLLGQYAGIVSFDGRLSGVLNNERIAWECKSAEVSVNKESGQFKAIIPADNFVISDKPEGFVAGTESGKNKYLVLSCVIPVPEVNERRNQTKNLQVELTLEYNGLMTVVPFHLTILTLPRNGFSMTGQGNFRHADLEVEGLKDLDNDLLMVWNVIGTL